MSRSLLLALLVVALGACANTGASQPAGASVLPSGGSAQVLPRALAALDTDHLVVVGTDAADPNRGAIATSADGGQTWASRSLPTPPLNGVALNGSTVLVTADCAQASGPGCVWSSTDGGRSFADLAQIPRLVRPALSDERTAWLVTPPVSGQISTLWRVTLPSGDWGQTTPWCDVPVTFSAIGMVFTSSSDGWMACSGNVTDGREARSLARVINGGENDEVVATAGVPGLADTLPASGILAGLSMLADGHGRFWTQDALYASTDSGKTWASVLVEDAVVAQLRSAQFVTPTIGFAVLAGSPTARVARTTDGGRTWTTVVTFPT